MPGIASPTDAEAMAMRICAERNGACQCEKTWGFPRDALRDCAALLERVRAGLETVKREAWLSVRETKALAEFFAVWWAALALAPGNNRHVRGHLAKLGLIKRRGPLALTPAGERVLKFAKGGAR